MGGMPAADRLALCSALTAALGVALPESVRLYGPGDAVVMVLELSTAAALLERLSPSSLPQEGGTDGQA